LHSSLSANMHAIALGRSYVTEDIMPIAQQMLLNDLPNSNPCNDHPLHIRQLFNPPQAYPLHSIPISSISLLSLTYKRAIIPQAKSMQIQAKGPMLSFCSPSPSKTDDV
jgi:hypothetical protein